MVGITGSVGKTSTKDILAAMLAQKLRTVANRENLNTEIGLPMTVLEAPAGTEALVLEMGMRGAGQIAELTAIAEPEVGLITAVAPVHLELMGSIEAIAAAKAELVAGLRSGGTAIVPAGESLLDAHRRDDVTTVTFGPGGDVDALPEGLRVAVHERPHAPQRARRAGGGAGCRSRARRSVGRRALQSARPADRARREASSSSTTATTPTRCRCAPHSTTSPRPRPDAASPCSGTCSSSGPTRPASTPRSAPMPARRASTCSSPSGPRAAHFADGYGELIALPDAQAAAAAVPALLQPGDTVLLKGSRGVGLEVVARALEGD